MTTARVRPYGDGALLVVAGDLAHVRALDDAVRGARARGDEPFAAVVDQVPAADSVLLRVAAGTDLDALGRAVERIAAGLADPTAADDRAAAPTVELPVRYDGPDLAEVAELTGLTPDEVVRRHLGAEYTVAFGGFMPGFAYLVGLDPALRVGRRGSPRERVPPGAVGLADEFTAVYPSATPGGWRLIGSCDARLFDVRRDPPAVLSPGTRVRFVEAGARTDHDRADGPPHTTVRARDRRPSAQGPSQATPASARTTARAALTVLDPGVLTLVEDLGRPGWAHVGVGRAGAADPAALRLANRLVGNPEDAAALEVLLGNLRLRADGPATVALTGAPGAADVDGHPVGRNAPLELAPGQVLHLATAEAGLRVYLAVRGGVDVEPVLGSRSSDQLASLGPALLVAGDRVAAGPIPLQPPPVDVAPVHDWPHEVTLHATPGPHADWFEDAAAALEDPAGWLVTPATNRVALRLDGTPLRRTAARQKAELAPAGLVPGAVQVPPNGLPIVFGVDHPVTGGYPVVAVVRHDDLRWLGQLRPGERVRLRLH
jgi:KipI family sensor histidine kinase inhibitor